MKDRDKTKEQLLKELNDWKKKANDTKTKRSPGILLSFLMKVLGK